MVILSYSESAERLNKIISSLRVIINNKLIKKEEDVYIWLPIVSLFAAFQVQFKVLNYLNDRYLNCGLAWDEKMNFPSTPSLIADVESYVNFFSPAGDYECIFKSFAGWTLFDKQEMFCFCGGKNFKRRKVALEIMFNHILTQEESSIVIKQLLGVRTDDIRHIENHYNLRKPSRVIDSFNIIWSCLNRVEKKGGDFEVEHLGFERAEEFDVSSFQKRILELT